MSQEPGTMDQEPGTLANDASSELGGLGGFEGQEPGTHFLATQRTN